MTQRDIDHIAKRKHVLKAQLKAQHSLPKVERDEREIESLKHRISVIDSWTGGSAKITEVRTPMKKDDFKQQFKEDFDIKEPEQTMVINTIAELRQVWPIIAGKNILIQAPPEVKAEMRRMIHEHSKRRKTPGFR